MRGKLNQFERRKQRVRRTLAKNAGGRPRLSVFRSSKHIYAQVIDDAKGHTVAAASSLEKDLKAQLKTGRRQGGGRRRRQAAGRAGASRPASSKVVFDRGGYRYHGRIKALADGAREGGLSF